MFDVVYVTYNSKKWLDGLFTSWKNLDYDLKKINIYLVDNQSTDDTVAELEKIKNTMGSEFGSFEVLAQNENYGFGKGNNIGFQKGKEPYVCFLNTDTELYPDTFKELEREVTTSEENVGLWEFRQFPYEHPKFYDVLTGATSWSSGAAFAVKRELFGRLGGFDEKIFMYAEDVDLSWRIRAEGMILKYCPRVRIKHYSYESAGQIKPIQYVSSVINNLLLRYRFGGRKTVLEGHALV